jgi:hypothetical protein
VIKQVNVEMTSPAAARKILSGNSCKSCVQDSSNVKANKESVAGSSSKPKEEKVKTQVAPIVAPVPTTTASTTSSLPHQDDVEEGEIFDEIETDKSVVEAVSDPKLNEESHKSTAGQQSETELSTIIKPSSWTMEEDRLILGTVQGEDNLEEAFEKLTSVLPQRDITEVKVLLV